VICCGLGRSKRFAKRVALLLEKEREESEVREELFDALNINLYLKPVLKLSKLQAAKNICYTSRLQQQDMKLIGKNLLQTFLMLDPELLGFFYQFRSQV
jgi:hypothetical protein